MTRPGPRTWTALLLLAGGVLLGLLGLRHLALERERGEARSRELERRRLAEAVANAPGLARQPRGAPLVAWEVEPPRLAGTDDPVGDRLREELAAARSPGTPARVRLERWERLTTPDRPTWLRQIACYHAGLAALALDDAAAARTLFGTASHAAPLLVSDGVRVRAAALQQLALQGLRDGDGGPLEVFLEVVHDGRRLARGDVVGPEDLLLDLVERQSASGLAVPAALHARLQGAARRARLGVALLGRVPAPGDAAVVEAAAVPDAPEGVVLHTPIDLQVHGLESLVAPPPGYDPRATAAIVPAGATLGPLSARLAAPFEAVVVTVDPEPAEARSLLTSLALTVGLGLYAVGAVLALRGWRRSREAARMQADFTAAVSHEMKTPIASVRAMAEMLQDGDPERVRRYAGRIEAEMQRLGTTVRNVLDVARIERGVLPVRPVPTDPAAAVLRIVGPLRLELECRGFDVEVEVLPAAALMPVDAEALEGVLRNLLDNAAKFSSDTRRIRIEGTPVAGGYRIAVLDRGVGLEEAEPERLFERFHRGAAAKDGAVPGVGLGLHIAQQLIHAHGGRLTARPRAGGGAAFEIFLPHESRAP